MHNAKGDLTLTNRSRETNYFHDFMQYTKYFFSLWYVLSTILKFWYFQPHFSGPHKKSVFDRRMLQLLCLYSAHFLLHKDQY